MASPSSKQRLFAPDSALGFAPDGWPVAERGLFMAYVGRVLVVRVDDRLTEAAFERYLAEWPRAIDTRAKDARAAAFYDVPAWTEMTAMRRRRIAALLKSREEMLRLTTYAMVLSTPSTLVRGMIQAIFWVAPPKFPYKIVQTHREGFAFIEGKLPEVDAAQVEAEYGDLLARYGDRVGLR